MSSDVELHAAGQSGSSEHVRRRHGSRGFRCRCCSRARARSDAGCARQARETGDRWRCAPGRRAVGRRRPAESSSVAVAGIERSRSTAERPWYVGTNVLGYAHHRFNPGPHWNLTECKSRARGVSANTNSQSWPRVVDVHSSFHGSLSPEEIHLAEPALACITDGEIREELERRARRDIQGRTRS